MLTTASTIYGRGWGQEEKGMTEDEMAGWHHWLNGRESEWILGAGDGQGGPACCDSWGRKESDTTERLNWTELNWKSRLKYLGKKWCLNSTGSGWWERGKTHALCTEDSLLTPCAALAVMDPKWAAQFIEANDINFHSTSLPFLFLVLALSLKQLWEVGEGSLLLGNTPSDSLGFDIVPDHPFGPSTLFSILKS